MMLGCVLSQNWCQDELSEHESFFASISIIQARKRHMIPWYHPWANERLKGSWKRGEWQAAVVILSWKWASGTHFACVTWCVVKTHQNQKFSAAKLQIPRPIVWLAATYDPHIAWSLCRAGAEQRQTPLWRVLLLAFRRVVDGHSFFFTVCPWPLLSNFFC